MPNRPYLGRTVDDTIAMYKPHVSGTEGAVSSNSPYATQAGLEIMKQGGRYGVRLKASAPSIHMIMANIETEVSPALGGEKASEQIINFLLQGFEGDTSRIWESNIFGKSLYDIASEGVITKLRQMPVNAQAKLQQTLTRIVNEGGGSLICIII